MNGQTEIDRLVALFTRVLHYNLGKEGRIVTLGEELEVLQDYLALQQIRYAHQFRVEIDFDEQFRPVVIPRFILQPIVENAIHHGLGEHGLHDAEGLIRIAARRDGDDLLIAVQDNGKGMTDEAIARLLSGDAGTRPKSGLGIGLRYVKQTMELYYGDKASIAITAEPGVGTTFRLRLPLVYREEDLA
jgi:two-component system sensor histidine kinase YesM